MLIRSDRHRRAPAAAACLVGLFAALAAATSSAHPQPARAARVTSTPTPKMQMVKPTPPAIQPTRGRSFIPVQGDWEGSVDGFAASFNLVLDAVHQQRAGVPQYGIQDLVMLRPRACPPNPAHYEELILGGRLPSVLGDHGSFGLPHFGLQGRLTGRRAATLQVRYSLPSCHGMLTWRMRPAVRRTVANGTWTLRYAGREKSTFRVVAGGRLATAVRLPRAIAACNGLQGMLDLFIGNHGRSAMTQAGVALKLRFANGHATGTLTASGCHGPLRVTAIHSGG
jgi:hypothetical protein